MTQERLRDFLSVFLLAAHVGVPAILVAVFLADGFTRPELTESLMVVVPMLSVISAMAVAHIIGTKKKGRSKKTAKLSSLYVAAAITLPVVFVALIALAILLKAYNLGLRSLGDFKVVLAAVETVFGTYTGGVMSSLFDNEKQKEQNT
jgi:hypothetical protein